MITGQTITVNSHLTDDTRRAVEATLTRFEISQSDMVAEIGSKVNAQNLALGAMWYREAFDFAYDLACRFQITEEQASAVIAALSPRMGWVRNKEIAEHVIRETVEHGKDASEIKGALGANIRMAHAILHGEDIDVILTGIKRRSFYNNIVTAGMSDDVTVDTWMQRVAMNVSPEQGMDLDESQAFLKARNHAGYIAIAEAVRTIARLRNVSPATVQAAYWIEATGSVHGWHWKGKGITEARTY